MPTGVIDGRVQPAIEHHADAPEDEEPGEQVAASRFAPTEGALELALPACQVGLPEPWCEESSRQARRRHKVSPRTDHCESAHVSGEA